jgi:transposase
LEDLLNVPPEKVHTDRLYEGLDELLPHKETIEKHLRQRLGQLFDVDYELLLYDVTSTYFEGQCKGNPQAKRGYSRDKRPDCLQVCIALVVTTDGLPLGYEVFAGNRHDSTTVEEIVEAMERKHGKAQRIWVLDRGMVSESNLSFVRGREGRYIVGTPKASLRTFEAALVEKKDWDQVEAGVEVKLVPSPDGEETFILARSAERREKEKAIHERFVRRLEERVQQLQAAMQNGRPQDESTAIRRLGRLQGENARAAKAFDVKIERMAEETTDAVKAASKRTSWCASWRMRCRRRWPGWMRASGMGDAPRSLLDELIKFKSGDIVLPVHGGDGHRHTVRLRCTIEPDSEQELLLHRLDITLPKRLGSQPPAPQM